MPETNIFAGREQSQKIKTAYERSAKAISLRPSLGLGTGVSRSRITSGLAVEITEGTWKLSADMPPQAGGEGAGPTPGVFGRAALGSCLAMGYSMEAARAGLDVSAIEVEVQADYDDGVLFGVSSNAAGYSEVRYTVTIESDAPEEEIRRIIELADAHSPYLDVFSRAQTCKRAVRILPAKGTR